MSNSEHRPAWQRVVGRGADVVEREPSAPVYDIPEDREHDSREEIEWFQKLPEYAKDEIRDAWRRQDGEHDKQKLRRRETTYAYLYEGALLFFAFELILMGTGLVTSFLAGLLGMVIGVSTRYVRVGATVTGILYGVGYVFFGLIAGGKHPFYYVLGSLIVSVIGMAFSRMHDIQRFDGSEL